MVTNGVCPEDTALILVNVDPSCNYSLGLNDLSLNVSIYPNPSTGIFQIQINGLSEQLDLLIEDINGRVIQYTSSFVKGDGLYSFDLSNAISGIYFVRLKAERFNQIYKIIKQ